MSRKQSTPQRIEAVAAVVLGAATFVFVLTQRLSEDGWQETAGAVGYIVTIAGCALVLRRAGIRRAYADRSRAGIWIYVAATALGATIAPVTSPAWIVAWALLPVAVCWWWAATVIRTR